MPSFNLTIELYKANRIVFWKPFRYVCLRDFGITTVGHIGQMGLILPRSEAAPPLRGGKADINIYKLGYKKLYLCGRETDFVHRASDCCGVDGLQQTGM